jgi:hypothetical protein
VTSVRLAGVTGHRELGFSFSRGLRPRTPRRQAPLSRRTKMTLEHIAVVTVLIVAIWSLIFVGRQGQ